MLNRWQAHKGAACGEVASIIMCLEVAQHCSTSSTPNDSEVPLPAGCAIAPPAVMHGLPSPMAHPRGGRRAYYDTPLQVGKAGLLSQIILKIELICVSQSPIRGFCESISITFAVVAGRIAIPPPYSIVSHLPQTAHSAHNRASGCNFNNLIDGERLRCRLYGDR